MSTKTVTIPQREYQELVEKKFRYEHLRSVIEEDVFSPPPTQSVDEVVRAFTQTKKYSKKFLEGLRRGLQRSSHFKT